MTKASAFVLLLQREQIRARLSDNRFSRDILGISPSTWNLLKKGKRSPGHIVIMGALRAFPELEDEIAAALKASYAPRPDNIPALLYPTLNPPLAKAQ